MARRRSDLIRKGFVGDGPLKNSTLIPYVSSSCSKKNKIGNAIHELAEFGFKNIELTGGTIFYDDIESDLIRLKKEYGLNYLIHNYFPPPKEDFVINVASRKTDIQDKTLALVKEALKIAQIFGKNLYTMHPGFISEMLPELKDRFFVKDISTINFKNNFFKALDFFSEEVIPRNFKIGVENLGLKTADDKFSFLCGRDDIEQFLEYFKNNKSIGILLDLGHLNVAAHILRFDRDLMLDRITDKYAEKIFAFHLSENDGYIDSHDVVPVNSWQLKYLMKHKKVFSGIPVVFEWHGAASKGAYKHSQKIEDLLS